MALQLGVHPLAEFKKYDIQGLNSVPDGYLEAKDNFRYLYGRWAVFFEEDNRHKLLAIISNERFLELFQYVSEGTEEDEKVNNYLNEIKNT